MTQSACIWCGRRFTLTPGPGRPQRFCKRSCRQRDYEARSRAKELGLTENELVVTREVLDALKDRVELLAFALEDAEHEHEIGDETKAYEVLHEAVAAATGDRVEA